MLFVYHTDYAITAGRLLYFRPIRQYMICNIQYRKIYSHNLNSKYPKRVYNQSKRAAARISYIQDEQRH